jgi:hypothetical protein
MQKSNMSIVNVIDIPSKPGPAIDALAMMEQVDAVFYYAYS